MNEHGSLPRARQDDLLVDGVGDELVIYDQNTHTAHCLSPLAANVWRHCDGERDVTRLAELAGVSESVVANALYELREKGLLDTEPALTQDTVPGESRREAIVRVGRYGAAATGASMIVSAAAATPAMASSGENLQCCQCYKNETEICACRNGFANNVACNKWCQEEPVGCTSGELVGTKCGLGNKCE